jgi:hypothetical protein
MHSLYGISLQIREVKGFKFKFIFTYKKGIKIDKKFSQSETADVGYTSTVYKYAHVYTYCSRIDGQVRLHDEQTVNGLRKIAFRLGRFLFSV